MPSIKINTSVSGSVTKYSTVVEIEAGGLTRVEEVIPAGSTDLEVMFSADISQLKAFFARSTGGALTVKFNDPSVPTNTFELATDPAAIASPLALCCCYCCCWS